MLVQQITFHALVLSKNGQTKAPPLREQWKPRFPRPRRLSLKSKLALTIRSSQRVFSTEETSNDAEIRVSRERGVKQLRLDGSYVRMPDKVPESNHSESPNSDVEYARSGLLSDRAEVSAERAKVSVERITMAGRDLAKRMNDDAPVEEGVWFNPKIGDYVVGIVASGNYGKLDIDIGAGKLAHLFRKDVIPVEICDVRELSWRIPGKSDGGFVAPYDGPRYVHDEEVLDLAMEVPMMAELGTVFTLEVKGFTPAGVALLSARSVARGYAWQRVRQLHEHKAVLKVQITEWTAAGLIAKIEGLRAFLPFYYLLNRPPKSPPGESVSYKQFVGQTISVMITIVDEMSCNLVISEKQAWMTKNAYVGALVDGIITDIHTYGLHVRVKNTDLSGILHISNISRARIHNIECLFCVGEQVRVMVIPSSVPRKLSFSTADLEMENGLMLRDKEAVYRGAQKIASEIARVYSKKNSEPIIDSNGDVDEEEHEIVIANWDWLDFDTKLCLEYD